MTPRENAQSPYQNGNKGDDPEVFVPRLVSWNTTFRCNLRCPHCYLDAGKEERGGELTTEEGKRLIDQIAEVSSPLLIFSGGEPLLRKDIFDLARYATDKGLKTALGTNGTLITEPIAERLLSSGVKVVAVSIDSSLPGRHDGFRGVQGSWKRAMQGIEVCTQHGIDIQVNTTVTPQNYQEIDAILALAENLGARSFHLFFLVPTGRGVNVRDISGEQYEHLIEGLLDTLTTRSSSLMVRPVCAPQFLRIATRKGMDRRRWGRGCIAGLTYCRVDPTGEVTPCPYLPLSVGNIRQTSFGDLWSHAPAFNVLRDRANLKGKCGRCEYREVCGGCRARAYGMTGPSSGSGCGELPRSVEHGDFLAEEPWCPYQPGGAEP